MRKKSETFFIADTHFGHANVIGFCGRPFSCVEEMDEALIANWNAKVRACDIVYVIGDMFFRAEPAHVTEVLERLKGKKHLILGNHDGSWTGKVRLADYFVGVDRMLEFSDGERLLTLCHYPMVSWGHEKRSWMIHGHIHNSTFFDFWPLIRRRDRVLNAGADINGLAPVTFDELVANNIAFKAAHAEGKEGRENV